MSEKQIDLLAPSESDATLQVRMEAFTNCI